MFGQLLTRQETSLVLISQAVTSEYMLEPDFQKNQAVSYDAQLVAGRYGAPFAPATISKNMGDFFDGYVPRR